MRGPSPLALFTFASLLVFAPRARATEHCGNPLVSTCIDADTLWPHPGPSQMLTLGGTETTARGQFAFGVVATYLSRPITLHLPSPGPRGGDAYAVEQLVNGTFLWSYGVTDRLELGLALPVTFGQGGAGIEPITGGAGLKDTAMRDLRFGAAYAILPRARVGGDAPRAGRGPFALTARFEMSAPTGDEDQFAGERAAVFIPSVAGDARFGRLLLGVELGARLRPTSELVGARVGSQLMVGAGAGYDLLATRDLLTVTAELRALPILTEQHDSVQTAEGLQSVGNGTVIVPSEWAISLRTAPIAGGDFSVQAGGGGSLSPDAPITTPRYRFILGIRYAPLARDSDGDGVVDRDDRCPRHAGSRASGGCEPAKPPVPPAFQLRPGSPACDADPSAVGGFDDEACPDADSDKDTIDDRRDACPAQPEDFAGLPDGCPEAR